MNLRVSPEQKAAWDVARGREPLASWIREAADRFAGVSGSVERLASGGVEPSGASDPVPGGSQSAPPEASEWERHTAECPARAGSVYYCECGADPTRARGVDPAEAGVTPGDSVGQAVQAEEEGTAPDPPVSLQAARPQPAQGNDLAADWKGPDRKSKLFRG